MTRAFDERSTAKGLCLPAPGLTEAFFPVGKGGVGVLTDEQLYRACGTRIAFTQRLGGVSKEPYASLNLKYETGDDDACVRENQRILFDAFGVGEHVGSLVQPNQVHGDEIVVVDEIGVAQELASRGADGIVCTQADVPVLLCFADCVPVIVVAPGGAFAVAHAGWRGSLAGIPGKALEWLCKAAGCTPQECNCYIGPHVGSCCYEVSEELIRQFVAEFGEEVEAPGCHLDLSAAVCSSLRTSGADLDRIVDACACTSCDTEHYYSYRAEDKVTGRHGAFAVATDDASRRQEGAVS